MRARVPVRSSTEHFPASTDSSPGCHSRLRLPSPSPSPARCHPGERLQAVLGVGGRLFIGARSPGLVPPRPSFITGLVRPFRLGALNARRLLNRTLGIVSISRLTRRYRRLDRRHEQLAYSPWYPRSHFFRGPWAISSSLDTLSLTSRLSLSHELHSFRAHLPFSPSRTH